MNDSFRMRILVVDDDIDVADALAELLRLFDMEAEAAYSGKDAIRLVNDWRPDAIFLDIRMPDLDGFDTAKAIRALPGLENISIFALSGWSGPVARAHAEAHLFTGYLTKPANLQSILHALKSVSRGINHNPN
ncbi:MAG TPA: response regulator [Pseudoduganella sp.]|jgi:CheY-like chemotaxis protein